MLTTRFSAGASLGAMLLAAAALPGAAHAQDAAEAPEAEAAPEVTESAIVVTGSRLATGMSAPTPVSVIGSARLEQRGAANIADALNEIPAFRATNTPAGAELAPAAGYIGDRILDLRGLGSVRTLTLVDGKRFVPATTEATVDTNMVPGILLERAEVVTGGASAAYGSDAVSGVVNLILNNRLDGIKASAQHSISKYGDNSDFTAGLAFGTKIGETLHLVVGGEYQKSNGIGDCQARAFCRTETLNFGRNPGDLSRPALNILPDIRVSSAPFNGVTLPTGYAGSSPVLGPVSGITFDPVTGAPRRFQYGSPVNSLYMVGGEGEGENIYFKDLFNVAPTERYAITGNLTWEISPSIKASLQANYGHLRGEYSASRYRNASFVIQRDNPFIPRSTDPTLDIPSLLAANNLTSFRMGKGFNELGRVPLITENEMYRVVGGLEGQLGGGWSWDAYYEYGHNDFKKSFTNSTVTARMTKALDAVSNGAGGAICRVNADADTTNNDAACVAYNPFGQNASAAAKAYVTDDGFQTSISTQNVIAGNIRGNLFDLPAGPVAIALGGEFRRDKVKGEADAISSSLGFFAGNGSPISGKIDVTEGYVEAEVPLLADMAFANELSLNGAIRRTHYKRSSAFSPSSSVNVTTWKVGGIYEPIEGVRFRATRSRDTRAPNISELFGPTNRVSGILNDPQKGGAQTNIFIFGGANPNLVPETADTFTAGIVLAPRGGFLGRFRASVDYYDIKISDAITTLGQQNIATRCGPLAGPSDAFSCSLITRDASGTITSVNDVLRNLNQLITRGIDFELGYKQPLGKLGDAELRLFGTYVKDLLTVDAVGPTERAGQTGQRGGTPPGVPDLVLDAMLTWNYDVFSLNTHARYINKGFYNAAFVGPDQEGYDIKSTNSANMNSVPSRTYIDILAQYRVDYGTDRDFTFFVGVDNVFNTIPPLNPGARGTGNNILFNPAGQTFKTGVRVTY